MKNISFSPMNALIKGTASAIKEALESSGLPEYTLNASSTYKPDQVDPNDQSLKTAKVVFEFFNEVYMTTRDMPLGKNPAVKFLILGDGGNYYSSDGTYFIFKDFAETAPSAMMHETYINPHMEEFDGEQVIEQVWGSFLDHEWSFEFEDYSCGEICAYAFKGKKAKELIAKWENDEKFQPSV